jgi:PhoH-like ATPase
LSGNELTKKVLDTNVLLDRPLNNVIDTFQEPTHLIIPLVVLNELDKFKKGTEGINENCRATVRFLDKLRLNGKLHMGVEYGKHFIQVDVQESDLDILKNDHQIILAAQKSESVLVSQDINVRVIADALNMEVENFAPEDVNVNRLYTGVAYLKLVSKDADAILNGFFNGEAIPFENLETDSPDYESLNENQFVIFTDDLGGEHEGIVKGNQGGIVKLKSHYKPWDISPKKDRLTNNVIREQRFLLHMLLDPEIEFVSAIGPSGCGKTFLTMASALEQVLGGTSNKTPYSKIVVMRPLVPIGKDIGYLPGDKLEKLAPWMASTFDALEHLLENYETKDGSYHQGNKEKIASLIDIGVLELEALAHIRGRSIPNQFIIVDDAQNLTKDEAASIITRAGEGAKVVFLGDISEKQIDNHRLTPSNNGLAYVVDRFKGADIVGHITLETVVRSKLAKLGVERL